jgi:hypothetical protein
MSATVAVIFHFLLTILFLSTALSVDIESNGQQEVESNFMRWLDEHEYAMPKIRISKFPVMGRGLVATTHFASNSGIFKGYPSKLEFSLENANQSKFGSHLNSVNETVKAHKVVLKIFLTHELMHIDESFWGPYLRIMLEAPLTGPLHWGFALY